MNDVMFYPAEDSAPVTADQIAEQIQAAGLSAWVQQPASAEDSPFVMIADGDASLKLTMENGAATAGALECPPGEMELVESVGAALAGIGWQVDETTT